MVVLRTWSARRAPRWARPIGSKGYWLERWCDIASKTPSALCRLVNQVLWLVVRLAWEPMFQTGQARLGANE